MQILEGTKLLACIFYCITSSFPLDSCAFMSKTRIKEWSCEFVIFSHLQPKVRNPLAYQNTFIFQHKLVLRIRKETVRQSKTLIYYVEIYAFALLLWTLNKKYRASGHLFDTPLKCYELPATFLVFWMAKLCLEKLFLAIFLFKITQIVSFDYAYKPCIFLLTTFLQANLKHQYKPICRDYSVIHYFNRNLCSLRPPFCLKVLGDFNHHVVVNFYASVSRKKGHLKMNVKQEDLYFTTFVFEEIKWENLA
ncbi:hypothetical protein EGR_10661 [Echinococcus granulosus]|uniref:Uncharacterized protein n=1 Tax=Echinococcus granulosus TaxID=6210 RepID=W6U7X3_ECHGR|nr:hypothetical protein EGR_10661 [Echinococcus granulosus]EUB54477.1 hypothetical protein EGR_10661 [Echinococcus granulosus]